MAERNRACPIIYIDSENEQQYRNNLLILIIKLHRRVALMCNHLYKGNLLIITRVMSCNHPSVSNIFVA